MAKFWDKIKFAKKPFKEGEQETPDGGVDAKAKKTPAKKSAAKSASVEKTPKTEKKEASRPATAFADVLVRPHLSEKAVILADKGTYVFEVRVGVAAPEVKRAIHAIYGVMPVSVRMINIRGRAVRFGRMMGTTRASKKAIVTLPRGKKLDIYG